MTTLLDPIVLGTCQTTLRGRRRSSHQNSGPVPRLFLSNAPVAGEYAICDDQPNQFAATDQGPPALSLPSNAHVSSYSTSTTVDRCDSPRKTYCDPSISSSRVHIGTEPASDKVSAGLHSAKESKLVGMRSLEWRLASGFFVYFLCGWGDGVTGTVLPYFTADFHLTSMTSSLLFAGSTLGFLTGTLLVERVLIFMGQCPIDQHHTTLISCFFIKSSQRVRHSESRARHLTLVVFSVLHATFFILIGLRPNYASTFVAYAMAAFSRAFMTASLNAFYASGPPQSSGYSFGLWSMGGVLSPITCQTIISSGVTWRYFYLGSLALSGINTILLSLTFKPSAQEAYAELQDWRALESATLPASPVSSKGVHPVNSRSNIRFALSLFHQWHFCVFALLYCGSETATQGFMVTYLLGTRVTNPRTVGYVTSGFWGGITIGRFTWGYIVPRLSFSQRKYMVLICLSAALVMHFLIWFINSEVENAVSASIIGGLYGPVFPAILRIANDILPSQVHMISMCFISASASLGSAIFPFVVGAISTSQGIHTLPYVMVPLGIILIVLWTLLPRRLPICTSLE